MKSRMLILVGMLSVVLAVGCSSNKPKTDTTALDSKTAVTALPLLPPATPVVTTPVDPMPVAVPSRTPAAPSARGTRPHTDAVSARTTSHETADRATHATGSTRSVAVDSRKYTVKKGDNLAKIAKVTYGDAKKAKQIALANHLADPNKIRTGQILVLPNL